MNPVCRPAPSFVSESYYRITLRRAARGHEARALAPPGPAVTVTANALSPELPVRQRTQQHPSARLMAEVIRAPVAGDNQSLTMTSPSPRTNRNTWTFGTTAVRRAFNDDLNLNVRGNTYPAGTQVIV